MIWGISDAINKRLCRFLLHRYLGHLLQEKLTLDQLSIDVYNGKGVMSDVNLDTEAVNDFLEVHNVPFCMVDGYAGVVEINVPWSKLMEESCHLNMDTVQITLQAQPRAMNCEDVVSHMLSSMVSSMTTSMELARTAVHECRENESEIGETATETTSTADEDFQGIEYFAQMIDSVLSRMCITLRNITVRIEHFQAEENSMGFALEIRIKRIDFMDELFSSKEKPDLYSGVCPETPITVQPHRVYTVPDVNKLVHIYGVELFTDMFSRPEQSSFNFSTGNSTSSVPMMTSMRARRLNGSQHAEARTGGSRYQPSYPIIFAKFGDERHSMRIKVKNCDSDVKTTGAKINAEVFFGPLSIFITPVQCHMLSLICKGCFGSNAECVDLSTSANFVKDLKGKANTSTPKPVDIWRRNDISSGKWSDGAAFYSALDKSTSGPGFESENGALFTSISKLGSSPDLVKSAKQGVKRAKQRLEDEELKSDFGAVHLKLRVYSVVCVLTHADRLKSHETLSESVLELDTIAKSFFEDCLSISTGFGSNFDDIMPQIASMYNGDHIQFLGSPLRLEYWKYPRVSERNGVLTETTVACARANLVECLAPTSTMFPDSVQFHFTQLLTFNESLNASPKMETKPRFMMNLTYRTMEKRVPELRFDIDDCNVEIDLSIVNRLRDFLSAASSPLLNSGTTSTLNLRENLFEPCTNENARNLVLHASSLKLMIKFPVPDLRTEPTPDRIPYFVKNVLDERLDLSFLNVTIVSKLTENFENYGSCHVSFDSLTGTYSELPASIWPYKNMNFVKVTSSGAKKSCVEVHWNFILQPLVEGLSLGGGGSKEDSVMEGDSECSDEADVICFGCSSNERGPFSKKTVLHEDEQILIIGDHSEIRDFVHCCRNIYETKVVVDVAFVDLLFPSKTFYEYLCNRLTNNLGLWPQAQEILMKSLGQSMSCASSDYCVQVPLAVMLNGKSGSFQQSFYKSAPSANFKSSFRDLEETDVSGICETEVFAEKRPPAANKFVLELKCQKQNVLLNTKNDSSTLTTEDLPSLIYMQGDAGFVCLVSGFEGNPDISYVTAEFANPRIHFCAGAVGELPKVESLSKFPSSQLFQQFVSVAKKLKLDMSPWSDLAEDTFSLVLKTTFLKDMDLNERLMAIGLRSVALDYRIDENWISAFTHFLNIKSFEVPGFDLPKNLTEFHLHCWNSILEYRPASLNGAGVFVVDSLDVSSNLVYGANAMRLHFLLDGGSLFVSNDPPPPEQTVLVHDYVCVLRTGLFEVITTMTESGKVGELNLGAPDFELKIKGDVLELRTCYDSCVRLLELIASLILRSEEEKQEDCPPAHSNPPVDQNPPQQNILCESKMDQIVSLVDSAMQETHLPKPAPNENPQGSYAKKRSPKTSSETEDETFCVLDLNQEELRSADARSMSIVEDYFSQPFQGPTSITAALPQTPHKPETRYVVKDLGIVWHLYGGRDFGIAERKTYSCCKSVVPEVRALFSKARSSIYTRGGPGRDHSVVAEIELSKVCFIREDFSGNRRPLSRTSIILKEVEVKDRLVSSNINKLLYRYQGDSLIREPTLPMLKSEFTKECTKRDVSICECSLKISMMPLKLNVDQDTLEFLIDFTSCLSSMLSQSSVASELSLRSSKRKAQMPSEPVMEIGGCESAACNSDSQGSHNDDLVQPGPSSLPAQSFSQDDETSDTNDDACLPQVPDSELPLYFTYFEFSPSLVIKFDYQGKRLAMEKGALQGLLAGIGNLQQSQINLMEIKSREGFRGFERLFVNVTDKWLKDIKANQISGIVAGLGPLYCLSEIFRGLKDIVWIPYEEYQQNGCVIRGVKRGARSFTTSTATALLDMVERLVGAVQGIAEFAYDIVNPSHPLAIEGKVNLPAQPSFEGTLEHKQPSDVRAAAFLAYKSVKEGLCEQGKQVEQAMQEERSRGHWSGRGVLKQTVPTMFKIPAVACNASKQLLDGVRNQINPDVRQENLNKWK